MCVHSTLLGSVTTNFGKRASYIFLVNVQKQSQFASSAEDNYSSLAGDMASLGCQYLSGLSTLVSDPRNDAHNRDFLTQSRTCKLGCVFAAPIPNANWKSRGIGRGPSMRSMTFVARASSELAPPPIDHDLHDIMREYGAEFSDDGVPQTFGNDEEALKAAETGVVVTDMSHFGRLRVTGDDRIHFLHNQSTADFKSMKEGQGCYTVFTTPTARPIDLATSWVMGTSVILLVSPNTRKSIYDRLNKYIFFADKVEIEDITDKTFFCSITGPSSDELLRRLNLESIIGAPFGTHMHYAVEGTPVTVGSGSGLASNGYMLLLSASTAGMVWETLLKTGAVPMGANAWERLRIAQGRPAAGKELTDEFNVLEAGLWRTISLTKGCYIGQETIAKVITYDAVKQALWGIELGGPASPGASITVDGQKVGKLTSYTSGRDSSNHFGLGYIKRKAGGAGLRVEVNGVPGQVVDIPFATRSLS